MDFVVTLPSAKFSSSNFALLGNQDTFHKQVKLKNRIAKILPAYQ